MDTIVSIVVWCMIVTNSIGLLLVLLASDEFLRRPTENIAAKRFGIALDAGCAAILIGRICGWW